MRKSKLLKDMRGANPEQAYENIILSQLREKQNSQLQLNKTSVFDFKKANGTNKRTRASIESMPDMAPRHNGINHMEIMETFGSDEEVIMQNID